MRGTLLSGPLFPLPVEPVLCGMADSATQNVLLYCQIYLRAFTYVRMLHKMCIYTVKFTYVHLRMYVCIYIRNAYTCKPGLL